MSEFRQIDEIHSILFCVSGRVFFSNINKTFKSFKNWQVNNVTFLNGKENRADKLILCDQCLIVALSAMQEMKNSVKIDV